MTVATVWSDADLHPAAVRALRGRARLTGPVGQPAGADPLAGIELAHAVLAGGGFMLDAATLQRAGQLRVIARLGTGFDTIDLDLATRHGVCVTHTPDAPTGSTAEFAVGLMLGVSRRITLADRALRTGQPPTTRQLTGVDLAGATLGLVGLGRIGARVAQLVRGFGMEVIAYDPEVSPQRAQELAVELIDDLFELLPRTDVLSLHVPLTARTRGLIGPSELARLRPGAIVVNVSRGPVLDTGALVEALDEGRLAGAGIDVWSSEPPEPDHPLLHREEVIATPHIAAMTEQGRARSNVTAVAQVLDVLAGVRPPGLLNPAVWHRRGSRVR